ncbi:MAG: thermonuclease family protein [Pyrinomonadaceae bacterium]
MSNSGFVLRAALWCALVLLVPGAITAQQISSAPAGQQQQAAVANNLRLVIEGKVINVHDGDTVTVLDQDNKKFAIRLQGIDAPELKQEFGSVSQQNLSRMVLGRQVTIVWTKVDKYKRTVGTIMLDGHDMNIEQVRAGLAWHFKKYEDEQSPDDRRTYATAEQEARAATLGLWRTAAPTAPGDWRQEVKTKRWGPPPPEGTIIGNSNSKKYHRPDCAGYRDMAERNRVFFKSVAEAEAAGYKRAGNCPPEAQILRAKITPAPVQPQPIPTDMAPPKPSVMVPIKPQVAVPTLARESTPTTGQVIGNKNSKVYHLPGCSGYSRVSEKNQVKFETPLQAEAAGYRLAGNCSGGKTTEATVIASPSTADESTAPTPAAPPKASSVAAAPGSPTTPSDNKVIGNKNSKVYHLPGCAGYTRVSEKNQEKFNTAKEAEAAGYRLAGNCKSSN